MDKNLPRRRRVRLTPVYTSLLDAHEALGNKPKKFSDGAHANPLFVREPKIADRIVLAIRKGAPYPTACRLAGISRDTFMRWMEYGRDGHPTYRSFYKRIVRAEARAEMRLLKVLRGHEEEEWRASAWQLERRWPENWAKRDAVKTELQVNGNISVNHKHELGKRVLEDDDAKQLARRLLDGREFGYEDITKEDA